MKITNWQTRKLSEVCHIGAGNSAPQKKEFFVDGVYPFFRTSDIGQIHIGRITKSFDYLNEKGIKGLKLFNKGTILLPKSGASTFLNHRVVLGINGYVSSHLATVKTDDKVLNNNYLFYFLQEVKAQDLIQDHKYPSLNLPVIENIEISYPESLPEQQRIVQILDEVFADVAKAKENAEKNLQNAKELFESYLESIFSNPKKDWGGNTLKEISLEFGRGRSKHRPRNDKKLYGGKYPFIQTGDIRNCNHYIREYSQTYNEVGLAQSKLWPKGTICITIAANIAETGILNFDACFPDSVIGIVVNSKKTNIDFVEYLLRSFKTKIQEKGKGSAQANINMATFEHEKFPIPDLSEQKSIVAKLDTLSAEIKKLEAIYKQKLENLEELKKAILKKAFAGEL